MKIELYDTTLRDGAQQSGISLSLKDKINITLKLDELGIDTIEGGYAGSNPKDDEYFKLIQKENIRNSNISAFGSTRKPDSNIEEDAIVNALLSSEAKVIAVVGKSSSKQVLKVLETSLDENLKMIEETVSFLANRDRRVIFDAEHFFDGFYSDKDYALKTLIAAYESGADIVTLCDTNGGMIPENIEKVLNEVKKLIDPSKLGIHCHNDTDTAVACTLEAYNHGIRHIQGTINGYGERCGNTNLISLIANLYFKKGISLLSKDKIKTLTEVSNFVSDTVNRTPFPYAPYVGNMAFTHKGGMHASAVNKYVDSYQHMDPEDIGNTSNITVSELAGRSNVVSRLKELNIESKFNENDIKKLIRIIKEKENNGFSYEVASASLELLFKKEKKLIQSPFNLIGYDVRLQTSEENKNNQCSASIKLSVNGNEIEEKSIGNGPVAALDKALREALLKFYPLVDKVKLTDYKVRVVNESEATESIVRVSIESADDKQVWTTVGASSNIIEASWMALSDSMEWWLTRNIIY
ncbi:MAG: citramalate synthase [Chloroflexi bacterium]|nr:citramalate synthase [Chloroflexota bacterium]